MDTEAILQEIRSLLTSYVPRGYISFPEAVKYLGVPEGTLREWIRTKGVPYFKPGRHPQFKISELDRWMERYRRRKTKG